MIQLKATKALTAKQTDVKKKNLSGLPHRRELTPATLLFVGEARGRQGLTAVGESFPWPSWRRGQLA